MHASNHFPWVVGFDHIVIRTVQQGVDAAGSVPKSGHHNDWGRGVLANGSQNLVAAESRQHDVQQHQIRAPTRVVVQGFMTICCMSRLESIPAKIGLQYFSPVEIILDDQYSS